MPDDAIGVLPQGGSIASGARARRPLLSSWRQPLFANSTVRREAKALLYAELALAVKKRIPLADALALACSTQKDAIKFGTARLENNAVTILLSVLLLLLVLTSQFGSISFVMLILMGSWLQCAGPVRVARLLALRLHHAVAAGATLAGAMEKYQFDFDAAERARFGAAEEQGMLAEALRESAAHEKQLRRLTIASGSFVHLGLFVLVGLFLIIPFVLIIIFPKLVEIGRQLDMAMPAVLDALNQASYNVMGTIPGLVFAFFIGVGVYAVVLRALLNGGNAIQSVMQIFLVVTPAAMFLGSLMCGSNFFEPPGGDGNSRVWLCCYFLFSVVGYLPGLVIFTPLCLLTTEYLPEAPLLRALADSAAGTVSALLLYYGSERLVRWGEQAGGRVAALLPGLGAVRRALAHARVLGGLTAGIQAGMAAPEALRFASLGLPRRLRRRADAAVALAAGGMPLGRALREARVLPQRQSAEVGLAERLPDLVPALQSISQYHGRAASEKLERWARLAEAGGIIFFAAVTFVVLLSVYGAFWQVNISMMQRL